MNRDPIYERLTLARVRLLAELARNRTLQEAAETLGYSYSGARSAANDLKRILDVSDVRAIGRWWQEHDRLWLAYVADAAGIDRSA